MALGSTSAALAAAVDTAPINAPADDVAAAIDFSALLEPADTTLPYDPQPAHFPFLATDEPADSGPPRRLVAWAMSRPVELADSPMAPLPPAIVAGPIGIAFASFIAWRAKRRGGRI